MPIYNAPITALDKTEVLRYAGFRGETPFPNALLEEACTEALTLTKPQGIWNIYKYDAATHMILSQPSFCLASNNLTHHLEKAIEIAIMTITIGSELETKASASFTDGNYTLGLLLDAAGTAAVETAADALNKLITTVSAKRGLKTLWRFS
ncbi:MAG: Vitamin dependent methionine synthase, activation domain, partial [Firmicutes bacterium]|nr:Vitamin dependent methionine synthase, activation domain [Bacillota bacterium]